MHKKTGLFLSSISLLFSFSLISCNSSSKVNLLFGDKNASTFTRINYLDLKEKVDSEETFLLVVQYSDGCACWQTYAKPILEKYIKAKHVIVYHITRDEINGGGDDFGITIKKGEVSFAIFSKGEVNSCVTTADGDALKDYNAFESYMSSLVRLPYFYYVSLSDIDETKKSNENQIIYFSRSTCGDCSYLNKYFIDSFMNDNPHYSNIISVLDCDQKGIRYDDEMKVDNEQWQAFKHKYGLSNKNNPNLGFDDGYVPTLQVVKNNEFVSQSVYFNDSVVKDGEAFKVSSSYYSDERLPYLEYLKDYKGTKVLQGLSLSKDDIGEIPEYEYVYWKKESASKYHDKLLERFLTYYEE